jgi:dihydrofolate reductase
MLSLIAAMSENRVIGRDGRLPWHLPDDLKWFKRKTMGHHIIMGRKTWESPGHPLPGRTSIVITRQRDYQAHGGVVVSSLDEALDRVDPSDREPFIIGGGEIFAQAIPLVDRMYLTIVHAQVEGDAYFPELKEHEWTCADETLHPADERHAHSFTFRTLDRR